MDDRLTSEMLAREFPCELRTWENSKMFGFVEREVWREVRLRGWVPILLRFGGREGLARLADVGENHLSIDQIPWTRQELELPQYSDHPSMFFIDWDRAVPERLAAEIVGDPGLLARWRELTFDAACDLIAPVRRARSPKQSHNAKPKC